MASQSFAPSSVPVRRISLAQIDAIVSARLGPTRGLGNSQPACFNRQVAMYLAAQVGRWSTTAIGRFYDGRDHSTVCHGIQRIEYLKDTDPNVDALIADLKHQLGLLSVQTRELTLNGRKAVLCGRDLLVPDEDQIAAIAKVVASEVWTHLRTWLEDRKHPCR